MPSLTEDDISVIRSGKDCLSGNLVTIISYDLLRSFSLSGTLKNLKFQVVICVSSCHHGREWFVCGYSLEMLSLVILEESGSYVDVSLEMPVLQYCFVYDFH